MNLTTLLVLALCACFVVIVLLLVHSLPSFTRVAVARQKILDSRANDQTLYTQSMAAMTVQHAADLRAAYAHDVDQLRLVVDALIDDRQRLVTAVLALSQNPQSARTLGMVDQARASAERANNLGDFLNGQHRTVGGWVEGNDHRESETTDDDGRPIIPVGMGSMG